MFSFFPSSESIEFHKWATACIAVLMRNQALILKYLILQGGLRPIPATIREEVREALGTMERMAETAQKRYTLISCNHKFERDEDGDLYCTRECGWSEKAHREQEKKEKKDASTKTD